MLDSRKGNMLILPFSALFLIVTFVLISRQIRKVLGINTAILTMSHSGNNWMAVTEWIDKTTGQHHKIVTLTNELDGVISVLDDTTRYYHTKQPADNKMALKLYHLNARSRFLKKMELNCFKKILHSGFILRT